MIVNMSIPTEKGKIFIKEVFWDKDTAKDFGYNKRLFHSKKQDLDIYCNLKRKDNPRFAAIRKNPKDIFSKKIENRYGKIAKNVVRQYILEV